MLVLTLFNCRYILVIYSVITERNIVDKIKSDKRILSNKFKYLKLLRILIIVNIKKIMLETNVSLLKILVKINVSSKKAFSEYVKLL